ncbi:hypothetical protein [Nocardioides terrisoli]|uniref:hypothetical protein n=1 Tax=Nocardioides terrisoli TaxID=3388267 RepID=UPI00287BA5F3|nr:hypothetical protein [Nocardioides marmorisolisilvae]
MTAERVGFADPWVGCVLHGETGVFRVLTDVGEVRASLDGRMLCEVARDRSCLPQAGDWVELRSWPDGRVTLLRALHPKLARVIQLRPRAV